MGSLNQPDERRSAPNPVLLIVARGKLRFLVRHTLVGTIILWIVVSCALMIRRSFHGLSVAYVVFLETVSLPIVIPFALAIAYSQWRKFHKMASMDRLYVGDQDTTRGRNDG
jgi:hypothetical protein